MRIKAEDTFAIVIDYQEKILPAMSGQEELLRKSQILLGGLKALEVPMILTTQYAKGLGNNIPAITDTMGVTEAIDKNTFSVYDNESVRQAIPHGKRMSSCAVSRRISVSYNL